LGKALAIELSRLGANVCIVARKKEILSEAAGEIKVRQTHVSSELMTCQYERKSSKQKIEWVAADVTDSLQVVMAFDHAEVAMGKPIDCVFACAGTSNYFALAPSNYE